MSFQIEEESLLSVAGPVQAFWWSLKIVATNDQMEAQFG